MRVERRMRRKVITVQAEETVERAHTLMAVHGIRHLPVLDGGRLVGVLSDRDIHGVMLLQRRAARGRPGRVYYLPPGVRVREAMTPDPLSVEADVDMEEAARLLLTRKIGCLPVLDHGRLVGIITGSDILWVFTQMMGILESSSRIDVVLGRSPRAMARATDIIREHRGQLICVGMSAGHRGSPRVHHFRLKSCDTTSIAAGLRRAGFRVLDRIG